MKDNQRVAVTKRLLYEGLLRLLRDQPLDKISITELCRESGINRATFYRHYNVPRDILLDMQVRFTEKMLSSFDRIEFDRDPQYYLEKLCRYFYDNAELVKLIIRYTSEEDLLGLTHDLIIKFSRRYEAIDGIDEADLKLVSAYVAGGSYNMLRQWLMEDIPKTPKEMSELIVKFERLELKMRQSLKRNEIYPPKAE